MTSNGRRFQGFVVATEPTVSIPRAFFVDVLPGIADLAELHVTLTVFRLVTEAGGIEQPIPEGGIRRDRSLRTALRRHGSPREPDARIATGLDLAVARGTILRFIAEHRDGDRVWYYVNTPANQALVGAMARGAMAPPEATWQGHDVPSVRPERPNVFRLYEQNVGLLTPLIADHLIVALETYPQAWIEEAIAEAVAYNKRSWRYVQRILEQWARDGRQGDPDRASRHTGPSTPPPVPSRTKP